MFSLWAWVRVGFVSAFVVAANLFTAVGALPSKAPNWLPLAVVSSVVFSFYVASERRREVDRDVVADDHRKALHLEAARISLTVASNGDCAPSSSAIGRSFSVHFKKTDRLLRAWHEACDERAVALKDVEDQTTKDAPGLGELVDLVIRGSVQVTDMAWSVNALDPLDPEGPAGLEVRPYPKDPGRFYTFAPKAHRTDVQDQLQRLSACLESVPTWPSVTRRATALAVCERLGPELRERLDEIQQKFKVTRARKCKPCHPGED